MNKPSLDRTGYALFAVIVLSCSDTTGPSGLNPNFFELVSGDAQTVAVLTQFPEPLVVRVLGTDTLPLRNSQVRFRVAAGSARIDSQSPRTDAQGIARAYVTPTATGNVQVSASVFSSHLSASFLLAASGTPAPPSCQGASAIRLVVAQVETDVGGSGLCITTDAAATYTLVGFNAPATNASASTSASISVAASGTGPAPAVVDNTPGDAQRSYAKHVQVMGVTTALVGEAQLWWRHHTARARSSTAVETVGQFRQFNVNFADACANPIVRTGRVVAVTATATIVADTVGAAAGFTDAEYQGVAITFDTLISPADTLNFKPPTDIDANGRVVLFFTNAVNQLPSGGGAPATALFQRRDLFPISNGTPARPVCASSNAGELIYLAVPDPLGSSGPARTKQDLLRSIPRAVAHEFQHLINASRRLYVQLAPAFEEPWLDEGLSQISEELLFQRASAQRSRENLNAYDLTLTAQSVNAFNDIQRTNIDNYIQFLGNASTVSPFSGPDSPAMRGATWSLLRYLVDRRQWHDFISWTDLVNTRFTGMLNLSTVFGASVRTQMRDWAVALVTDDLFSSSSDFQQPSWNFRSVFAAINVQPYPLAMTPLISGTPVSATLSPAAAAYFAFTVPAGGAATISWSGAAGATISPMLAWALVRIR